MEKLQITKLASIEIAKHQSLLGWQFKFSRAITVVGMCSYRKKTIYLSAKYAEVLPREEILDTILHEIAHALTPGHGHDNVWKAKCREIGANPERLYDGDIETTSIELPKYELVHKNTGEVFQSYHRKPTKKVMNRIHLSWITGRKEETVGKLMFREVSLLDFI